MASTTFCRTVTFLKDVSLSCVWEPDAEVTTVSFKEGTVLTSTGFPFTDNIFGVSLWVKFKGEVCDISYHADTGVKTYVGVPLKSVQIEDLATYTEEEIA